MCVLILLCCRDPFDHSMMGTVGLPLPGVDMRLEAVPELGYLPSDKKAPRGEVGDSGCVHWLGNRTMHVACIKVRLEAVSGLGYLPSDKKAPRGKVGDGDSVHYC